MIEGQPDGVVPLLVFGASRGFGPILGPEDVTQCGDTAPLV
jgi:hypothetical protein